MDDREVARMWDANAETWAHDVRAGYDTYRDLLNNHAFFELAGDLLTHYLVEIVRFNLSGSSAREMSAKELGKQQR